MKKYWLCLVLFLFRFTTIACPVCEANQPASLRGITHGQGPQSNWDVVIISVVATIVVVTLFYSLKWLIRPGEKSEKHIKRAIINWQ